MKVSACLITYNHEDYIVECIEGALSQSVDFDYEIVIGDDKSGDGTLKICEEYASKYPDKIRLIKRDVNLGMMGNWIDTIKSCQGKYIAICEGDDYWTDSLKLQKQVGFLEENEDVSVTCHNVKRLDYSTNKINYVEYFKEDLFLSEKEIIKAGGKITPTLSYIFRSEYINNTPDWVLHSPVGDIPLMFYLMSKGKVYYFRNLMGVYRENLPGSWTITKKKNKRWKNFIYRVKFSVFLQKFNEYSHGKYKAELKSVYYNGNVVKYILFNVAAYFHRIHSSKF